MIGRKASSVPSSFYKVLRVSSLDVQHVSAREIEHQVPVDGIPEQWLWTLIQPVY